METILKNKTVNKVFALVLSLFFVFSMNMTNTFAVAPNQTADVTVQGVENGAVLNFYKLVDVQFSADNTPSQPVYTWTDAVMTNYFNAAGNESDKGVYVEGEKGVADQFALGTTNGATQKELLTKILTALKNNNAPASKTVNVTGDPMTVNSLVMGQYIVDTVPPATSLRSYAPTTVNLIPKYDSANKVWKLDSVTTFIKGTPKKPSKTVDKTTTHVGDILTYTVSVDIPLYPTTTDTTITEALVKVTDTLSNGLDFYKEGNPLEFKPVVRLKGTPDALTSGYTLEHTPDTKTFTINFDTNFVLNNPGKTYEVEYKVVVNQNAFQDADGLGNQVFTGYRDPHTNSYVNTETVKKDVYTYGIDVTKKDKNHADKFLENAEFNLLDSQNKELTFKFVNGAYVLADLTDSTASPVLKTDVNGKLIINGLNVGTYYLKETKAPEGYNLPSGTVKIEIKDSNADGNVDEVVNNEFVPVTPDGTTIVDNIRNEVGNETNKSNTILFEVLNTNAEDIELPNTGGMGTVAFTVGGLGLMVGAAYFLFASKKK